MLDSVPRIAHAEEFFAACGARLKDGGNRASPATSAASNGATRGYAQEELAAELGAAFVYADLELATEPREENASYIAHRLEILKNDTRFILKAAARARRAAGYQQQQ